MSIYDFLDLCIDAGALSKIEIYDTESEKTVYSGHCSDIPDDLLYAPVSSWDLPTNPYCITLNIN